MEVSKVTIKQDGAIMKKLYSIQYTHIGGERHLQTTDVTEIADWILKACEDEYLVQSSIVINTEEKEA